MKLDETTIDKFREILKNRAYMVCWCLFGVDLLDVSEVRYDENGRFSIGCRGTNYFWQFGDETVDDITLEHFTKVIHSFMEVERPVVC